MISLDLAMNVEILISFPPNYTITYHESIHACLKSTNWIHFSDINNAAHRFQRLATTFTNLAISANNNLFASYKRNSKIDYCYFNNMNVSNNPIITFIKYIFISYQTLYLLFVWENRLLILCKSTNCRILFWWCYRWRSLLEQLTCHSAPFDIIDELQ